MNSLSWISDPQLSQAVDILRNRSNHADSKAEARMRSNVVDPFSSLIIASTLGLETKNSLIDIQKSGSALSGISSALGNFHQNILSSVSGWQNHDAGYDLENSNKKMLAEVKNKHNTMNSSNKAAVISDLDTAVRQKETGWTGYLEVIIPKRAERYERKLNTQRPVYEIDGASFYAKVTGDNTALHDLFNVLTAKLETATDRAVPEDIKFYCRTVLNNNIP